MRARPGYELPLPSRDADPNLTIDSRKNEFAHFNSFLNKLTLPLKLIKWQLLVTHEFVVNYWVFGTWGGVAIDLIIRLRVLLPTF